MSQFKYFAAQEPQKCASTILQRAGQYYNFHSTNGWLQKMISSYKAYYGSYYDNVQYGHSITFGGEQGEYAQIPVNHYRNIAQHMLVMTTSSRPAMEARAVNTDYKSQVQTILANGILDYYMREKRMEYYIKTAVEQAIVFGAGFIKMEWDAIAGEIYDYETKEIQNDDGSITEDLDPEKPMYEGDVKFTNLSPFDVVFDSYKEDQNHDWVVTRSFKNKYDLAARYPELENKIKGLQTKSDQILFKFSTGFTAEHTDDVAVYEFYHKRTEFMPKGRYMMFLAEDIILYDGEMPYRTIPVLRIAPSDLLGTPYGYTPMFDLLPLQEAVNGLYSTIMTNQSAFGVQNIYVPRGADITINALEGGLNVIEGNSNAGRPESLNLTNTPPEIFNFLQMMIKDMETLSGVNSVARGNPESSLKSGAALALVQSLALQFASNLQSQYIKLIEDMGTSLVKMLQDFAVTKRTITLISGVSNNTNVKEFSADDLSNVTRVVVDMANPLSRTTSGKIQLAESLLQYQLIKDPAQYLSVVNTGKLETATEDVQKEVLLIRAENEKLISGDLPMAVAIEDHVKHIKGHQSVLFDPELKKDPTLVQNVLTHIYDHIDLLQNTDPRLLQVLGQVPIPPPQQNAPQPSEVAPQQAQGLSSENASVMQAVQAGQMPAEIMGPGMEQPVNLPNIPSPPAPFQQNPVLLNQQ